MQSYSTFRILFFVLLGLMLVVRVAFNLRVRLGGEKIMPDRQAIRHEGVGLFAMRFIGFFVLVGVLILYAIDHPWMQALNFNLPAGLRWLGFFIGMLSISLTTWVEYELGRQFSPQLQLREGHELVTGGPFARVRHPLYSALNGFGLSLALVSSNWFFVFFFVLSLVALVYRVPKEEQMLLSQFGDDYRGYMKRTGRYFPKL